MKTVQHSRLTLGWWSVSSSKSLTRLWAVSCAECAMGQVSECLVPNGCFFFRWILWSDLRSVQCCQQERWIDASQDKWNGLQTWKLAATNASGRWRTPGSLSIVGLHLMDSALPNHRNGLNNSPTNTSETRRGLSLSRLGKLLRLHEERPLLWERWFEMLPDPDRSLKDSPYWGR